MMMKRLWSRLDLNGKFRLLAFLGLMIWGFNFSIVFFEINRINQTTVSLERFEDLYDAILETRRYEKNYLLYKGRDDYKEAINYLQQSRRLCTDISDDGAIISDKSVLSELNRIFHDYSAVLEKGYEAGVSPARGSQEEIRSAGKRMVDLSQAMVAQSRKRVATTARSALRWPLTTTALFMLLFIMGALLVNRKVVNPLVTLERATKKIGRGDFSLISHSARIDSEVDRLIVAFNRMVEELEARQEQIIHSRKIASLGTLVSGVAHELNNPINNIILTIDSLVGGRKITDDRRTAMLEDILAQAIRASGIVKNLLDFSRSETVTVQEIDISQLLEDTLRIAANQIALSNISVQKHLAADLPHVQGNRQGLQQVFLNLIVNAVQAMNDGGNLWVTSARDKNDRRIIITIRDTGSGISEENLTHIFDPFFTTKEVGRGTGLGLSVSYGIINKHGGRITVDSQVGKGSTFTVSIPTGGEHRDG
ncbi:MAG: HAMP domain-containing histidine kinase [Desulfobacterales bacterium]|nr:HAMP domain-containing histidine kinase [Desulfobacterales bacterium]